jgi:DNA-directed RNA polymerase specialized sigma24 family protein
MNRTTVCTSLPTLPPAAESFSSLDDLVRRAARADRDAIGAIASALTRELRAEANAVLHNEHDAADVVQDFFLALLQGEAERFAPGPNRGKPFLVGLVRAMARKRRRERRLL